MKKICIALSLILSLFLFGCGNDSTEKRIISREKLQRIKIKVRMLQVMIQPKKVTAKDVAAGLKDGTYEGTADPWDYGQESATVTIKDGKITDIDLKRLTKDGKEVNYDEWTGAEVDGKARPNLKQFKEDMASKMIEAQSYDVDTIATATVTTGNWKVAVQRALEKAK